MSLSNKVLLGNTAFKGELNTSYPACKPEFLKCNFMKLRSIFTKQAFMVQIQFDLFLTLNSQHICSDCLAYNATYQSDSTVA